MAGAYEEVEAAAFTEPAYAALHTAILAAGGPASAPAGPAWVTQVREHLPAGGLSSLASELSVERMRKELLGPDPVYAGSVLAALAAQGVSARIVEMDAELKRAEAAGDATWRDQIQADLYALQLYRRQLVERANRSS